MHFKGLACTYLTVNPLLRSGGIPCASRKKDYVISKRFMRGQNKVFPILALVGISKVYILISKGPRTRSPRRGHRANMNKMELVLSALLQKRNLKHASLGRSPWSFRWGVVFFISFPYTYSCQNYG